MLTISIPENSSLAGMVAVQNSPELLQQTKMALLLAANEIAKALKEDTITASNKEIIDVGKRLVNQESYREELAKIIINAGIVRGVFPNKESDYELPDNLDDILSNLINILINDASLIQMIL